MQVVVGTHQTFSWMSFLHLKIQAQALHHKQSTTFAVVVLAITFHQYLGTVTFLHFNIQAWLLVTQYH